MPPTSRRGFLGALATITAAVATDAFGVQFDPERALWIPGERTFFLPPAKVFTLYSEGELLALELALGTRGRPGLLRFTKAEGRPNRHTLATMIEALKAVKPGDVRVPYFDKDDRQSIESLNLLSPQELRAAIDTGMPFVPADKRIDTGRATRGYPPGLTYTDRGEVTRRKGR